jgi:hypothetical protein
MLEPHQFACSPSRLAACLTKLMSMGAAPFDYRVVVE